MSVIVLCNDLIFATKIRSTAEALGVTVKMCLGPLQLEQRLGELPDARLAIIDLNVTNADTPAAVARVKAIRPDLRVVAFLSHVQVELGESARLAGADAVLARSKFVQVLPELLSGSVTAS